MTDFKVGDIVEKVAGDYKFPGEVRAVVFKRNDEIRYVVESISPDTAGMLHIFASKQLKLIAP